MEIKRSEALSDNDTARLDNGYFTKDFLFLKQRAKQWKTLDNYAQKIVCGPFGSTILDDTYVESGIPMIRPFNLREMQTEHENIVYLKEEDVERKGLKIFTKGSLLFARVGEVGCGVLTFEKATISPNIIAAPLKHSECNPYYAAVFFNTHYGLLQMEGAVKAVAQPTISTDSIRALKLPSPSSVFQNAIEAAFKESLSLRLKAENLHSEAKQTLLRSLGLENWQPPVPLTYQRKARKAFTAGRLDAEHFQPKYDELLKRLSSLNLPLVKVKELSKSLKYGTSENLEYVEEGVPFLRIADLENKRFNLDLVQRISPKQAKNLTETVSTGDVLVSRSGTLGVAVPIPSSLDGAIYGSYFIRTRPDLRIVDPEYLALFINSLAGQLQVEQKMTGGVQTNLTIDAIESILIPIGTLEWQRNFVELVQRNLAASEQARALLDRAKRAVEIAIEESEEKAMRFLEGGN